MKYIMVLMFVATPAMALDFDTEWAKFSQDFARLKGNKVAIIDTPVVNSLPEVNSEVNVIQRVDPKSPKRLGRNLQNPYMKERLEKLYNNPNTIVYSLTLE